MNASVHVLSADLAGMGPTIRRDLEVPSTMTLGDLHLVLQAAFGWFDEHLHEFEVNGVKYVPMWAGDLGSPFLSLDPVDEDTAVLGLIAPRRRDVLDYTYDFGEMWRLRVEVVDVRPARPDAWYPACTGGTGPTPREDGRETARFGPSVRDDLNALLRRLGAVTGDRLPAAEVVPDPYFSGLFPDLIHLPATWEDRDGDSGDGGDRPAPAPGSEAELAAAAAASQLVRSALALAGWVGTGRKLTPSNVLRPGEAVEADEELGLSRPVPGLPVVAVGSVGRSRVRSAKDLPRLHALWTGCVAADLITVKGASARQGTADTGSSPTLDTWCAVLSGWLSARLDAGSSGRSSEVLLSNLARRRSLPVLADLAREPVPVLSLVSGVLDRLASDEVDYLLTPFFQLPVLAGEVLAQVGDWVTAGVLEVVELDPGRLDAFADQVAEAERLIEVMGAHGDAAYREQQLAPVQALLAGLREGNAVRLTGLGSWALGRILTANDPSGRPAGGTPAAGRPG